MKHTKGRPHIVRQIPALRGRAAGNMNVEKIIVVGMDRNTQMPPEFKSLLLARIEATLGLRTQVLAESVRMKGIACSA